MVGITPHPQSVIYDRILIPDDRHVACADLAGIDGQVRAWLYREVFRLRPRRHSLLLEKKSDPLPNRVELSVLASANRRTQKPVQRIE